MAPVAKLLAWETGFMEETKKLAIIHRTSALGVRSLGINYLLDDLRPVLYERSEDSLPRFQRLSS